MSEGKRVWKPLDVRGLRLYRVDIAFPHYPQLRQSGIVAAHSPTEAARLVEEAHQGEPWIEPPSYRGFALDVYQPAAWWDGEEDESAANE